MGDCAVNTGAESALLTSWLIVHACSRTLGAGPAKAPCRRPQHAGRAHMLGSSSLLKARTARRCGGQGAWNAHSHVRDVVITGRILILALPPMFSNSCVLRRMAERRQGRTLLLVQLREMRHPRRSPCPTPGSSQSHPRTTLARSCRWPRVCF